MSDLFGALDLEEIPEVLEDGTHPFILKGVRKHHSQSGNDWLVFDFIIDVEEEPDTLFPNFQTSKWFQVYPNMTNEELAELDTSDRNKVLNDLNNLRKWLRSLGIPEKELKNPDYNSLTGMRGLAYGTARENRDGSGKEWRLWSFTPDN